MRISLCVRLSATVAAIGFVIGASLVAQQPSGAPPPAGAPRPSPGSYPESLVKDERT